MSVTSSKLAIMLAVVVALSLGCAPEPEPEVDLVFVELALALDFEANDVLTVRVFDEAQVACGALLSSGPGDVAPLDSGVASAVALNEGGEASFDFDTLPAEIPLAFFGTATRSGTLLADDCTSATIPNGEHVEIVLVLVEAN